MDCPNCGGHMIFEGDLIKAAYVLSMTMTCESCGGRFFVSIYIIPMGNVTAEEF